MKKVLVYIFVLFTLILQAQNNIKKISTEMEVRTIFGGQSVLTKGIVCIDLNTQKTVTKINYPISIVTIQEKSGDIFTYEPIKNVVAQRKSGVITSSENVLKNFLTQTQNDLGLKEKGFKLINSKFNKGLVILTYEPPVIMAQKISYVELVTQNNSPIYIANFDQKKKLINKTYYTKYQKMHGSSLPMQIINFQYTYSDKNKKDSVVTKTLFSAIKINNNIEESIMNFKIPSNAKVVLE